MGEGEGGGFLSENGVKIPSFIRSACVATRRATRGGAGERVYHPVRGGFGKGLGVCVSR
jgi:hypothetical protein